MLGRREDIASLQSDFYRDQYYRMLRWLLGSLVILFLLIGTVVYLVLFPLPQQYYANTTDGKIMAMPMTGPQHANR